MAHLNHGSFGAFPFPVLAEQQRWRDRMDANPVSFFRRELQPTLDSARLTMSSFLGADADGVTFVQNSTSGAGMVFAAFPLAAGDEVLVTDHVYGAIVFGAQKAAARVGASVVVVDAAHAPGLLPVDLGALRPDFWVGNFHKWPCAPRGSAGLYVAERWRGVVGSFPVSWREAEGFPHSFLLPGTADQTGWLAVPAALEFFGALGGMRCVHVMVRWLRMGSG